MNFISFPSVVFEAVDIPCPGPFHFSHIADYIYDVCHLPDPDVCLSNLVCDVEHTPFRVGLCGRKFVVCLFRQCPGAVFMRVGHNSLWPVITPMIEHTAITSYS